MLFISPFVGRIDGGHKKQAGSSLDEAAMVGTNDPGLQSVHRIFNVYKKHGIATKVVGANFRNVNQITDLAGCDWLINTTAMAKKPLFF